MLKAILFFLLSFNILMAKDYTLIIGIGEYKSNILQPFSIQKDINTFKSILKSRDIHVSTALLNKNATKKNILRRLKTISNNIKKGDRFFMYFTGHGTSVHDIKMRRLLSKKNKKLLKTLNHTSGLITYGFDENHIQDSIIWGTELKKILKNIDKKISSGLIVFDACFSLNGLRASESKKIKILKNVHFIGKKKYSYKKLVYISSAIDKANYSTSKKMSYFSTTLNRCLKKRDKSRLLKLNKLKRCIARQPLSQIPHIYPEVSGDLALFK